ncbi:MAG: M20/M25/M40 family metallo-hydrolase [Firmicutes bacterium]|nr:M20/M25/M40 family metallo-hydrolase [Bacillota bacterium]
MDIRIRALRDSIESNNKDSRKLLEEIVNINSYAYNKEGVEKVAGILRKRFTNLGFTETVIPRSKVGNITLLSNQAAIKAGNMGGVLLNAHLDTVFEPGQKQIPYYSVDGIIRGHGVTDDKGGAVIIYQALKALFETKMLDHIPVRVLFNTDEEQGSDCSKDLIKKEASVSELVIVAEYGKPRDNGATVVTGRMGRGRINLNLKGRNSEVAMLEIMEKTTLLGSPDQQPLVRFRDYVCNSNEARAMITFGYATVPEGERLQEVIEDIIIYTAGIFKTDHYMENGLTRPPVIFDEKRWNVFNRLQKIGESIGFNLHPESRTAGSDASFVPDHVPVLDGMGPVGDKIHTDEEFMQACSLTARPLVIAELVAQMFS